MPQSVEDKIQRYHLWLNREKVDRPLTGLLWEPDIPPLPEFMASVDQDKLVLPERFDLSLFPPHIEKWHAQWESMENDMINPFTPAFGMPWVEAIAGCPVIAHPGSLWAESFIESYDDRPSLELDENNPWLMKMRDFTRELVKLSDGRFPVALPQMRGPLDALAAARGPEELCMDLVEQPDKVRAALEELTGLWIGIARTILKEIPPWHGGYMSRMKMWAPGPTITPQNDISTLISPGMYREFALDLDERIFTAFPHHLFHTHGTEYHHLSGWAGCKGLTAIQVTLEHTLGGPPMETMMPVMKRVLAQKPLLVCALDVESADYCIRQLPHEGLCVTIGLQYEPEQEHIDWAAKSCRN